MSAQEASLAEKIPAETTSTKVYTQHVTPQDILAARKRSRHKSKNAFSGLSAQQLAAHEKTNTGDTRYEFLHLLAHILGGLFERDNIVIGSWCANTEMMLYDNAAKDLLEKKICKHIDITIECTLKQKANGSGFTHHAEEIKLTYKTDTGVVFSSPPIKADSTTRPTVSMKKRLSAFIADVQKTSLERKAENHPNLKVKTPSCEPPRKRKYRDSIQLSDYPPKNAPTPSSVQTEKAEKTNDQESIDPNYLEAKKCIKNGLTAPTSAFFQLNPKPGNHGSQPPSIRRRI